MLSHSGMPKKFWGEAITTAARMINKSPSSAIDFKVSDELWYGVMSNYSYVKVFGCKAYVHIKQDKLEPRALRCVLLGYPKGTKCYKLWCIEPGLRKVIISRDVVFEENQMPFLSKGNEETITISQESDKSQVKVELFPEVEETTTETEEVQTEHQNTSSDEEQPVNDLENYLLARDRTRRIIHPPERFSEADMVYFALNTAEEVDYSEPSSYADAMRSKERHYWVRAIIEEIRSLIKNGTWILVDKPKSQRCVSCKWIFKKKIEVTEGNQIRFKARLVARGFTQREGIDFNEVFSRVVKHCCSSK